MQNIPWMLAFIPSHLPRWQKICPIYESHLTKEANCLDQKAKDRIFADQASAKTQQDGNDDDNDADDDNISDGSSGFDPAKLNELDNLNITTPGLAKTSTKASPASRATDKQPLCRKCGHIVKGHKRAANQSPKCPLCPNNLYSDNGGSNECSCEWRKPPSPQDNLSNKELLVSYDNNITILSFPESQSQATLSPTQASNACAIISCLVCCATYDYLPEFNIANLDEIQKFHVRKMMEINYLYDIKLNNQILIQPNLTIEEVLEKIRLPLDLTERGFIRIMDTDQLREEIKTSLDSETTMAATMMVLLDKTFAVCKKNDQIILFESHHHCLRGVLIAFTSSQNFDNMCDYIEKIIVND